jgi:hypothetical protein
MKALNIYTLLALLVLTQIGRADPLDTWTSSNPVPPDITLSGITYGDSQFVTVGRTGTILTSSDGIIWSQHDIGNNFGFSVVGYGNGIFVALGSGVAVASADGVTWSPQGRLFYDFRCFGLAYGNNRFVGVGQETGPKNTIVSADGANWEPGGSGGWLGHSLWKGQFVAVGGGIQTSPDGTIWAPNPFGPPNQLYGIAYGNGQFVAVGDAGTILSSADGVNWVTRQSETQNTLNDVAYGNGIFCAVSGWGTVGGMSPETPVNGAILTSEDGVNWTQRQTATTNAFNRIAYGNGRFVAVGHHGTILSSGPIINLTLTPNPNTGLLSLALEGPNGIGYTIQSSTDLISWQTMTNFTSVQPSTIIFDAPPAASDHLFYRALSQ